MRGPSLFIAQYIGPPPLFERLADIAAFARGLGFRALQVPVHDARILDLGRAEDGDYLRGVEALLADHGLVISELAAQRVSQLLAVHPAYDEFADTLAPVEVRGNRAARQARAGQDLRRAIALAQRLSVKRLAVFSGGFAWPYFYPYPPAPPALFERAFAELARLWRPMLDAADKADVDLCFELHPGQDLHDGATFERFLAAVDHHARAKLQYDPSHFRLQHLDYLGFIDRYHARIASFHVKDAEFIESASRGVYGGYADWLDRPGRFRSLGDGDIDFRGIFSRLARYGYDGWATLEWECCLKNAHDGAAEGARFIREHLIRVAEDSFDAGMRRSGTTVNIDRMLGLGRDLGDGR
jgi:sugar phosphate isomerase/epimerase